MSSPTSSRATTACGGRRSRRPRFSAAASSSAKMATCAPCPASYPILIRGFAGLDGFYAARLEKR